MAYAKRRKALRRSMLHWTKRNMNLLHLHSYESIKVTFINGDHILQMSNYKVLLDTGMTLKGSRKYFSKAKLNFTEAVNYMAKHRKP